MKTTLLTAAVMILLGLAEYLLRGDQSAFLRLIRPLYRKAVLARMSPVDLAATADGPRVAG